MPVTLHSALVPTWLRILRAAGGWLDKAEAFGRDKNIAEAEILELRLIEDMLPLVYQVKSMAVHSRGAIEGVRAGVFSPDMNPPPTSFDELRQRLDEAIEVLESVDAEEMEGWIGKPMVFAVGERRMEFAAEDFLLHFSHSNFHFHASTAYAILRMKGVELGKRDFMGVMPIRA